MQKITCLTHYQKIEDNTTYIEYFNAMINANLSILIKEVSYVIQLIIFKKG